MSRKASYTSYFYIKPLESEEKKRKATFLPEKKNTGSGAGYAFGKLGLGLANVFENTGKLVAGSLNQLFGDDRMAKYTFTSPTLSERADYKLTKNYNPNGAMTFVGDVASGLGQSSVFLLDAVGIPVGTTMFFGGAIGGGVSEAARTTGELGMKEYIYGTLTGATEGLLEKVTGKAGTTALTAATKGAKTTGLKLFAKEAVRKGLGRNMLESAGGEFIEEFLSEPMSVIWKRATGVDSDAEVNWMNAVYSGLVGFGSGGIMGGLTSSALNAYDYINGAKAKNKGREQVILNAAETIKERFKTDKKYSSQMNGAITNLQAAYNTYNNAKNERVKTIALGDMWRNIATLEASAGVQNAYERITDTAERAGFDASAKASAEEMAQTATRLFGKEITVDMLKNNTDNVSSDLAVHSWAVGFFANEDSRIREIENKIAFESAPEYSEENSNQIDEMGEGENFIYNVGSKKAIIYRQANGYNLGFSENRGDIQMARNLDSEQVKLMLADAKEENLSKYKVAMAADRFYENYSGKSTEDTENEEKNVPTQETATNDNEETEKATTNPEKQENATERKKTASEEESREDTNSNDNDDSGLDQEQGEREETSKTEKLKKKKERTTAELDRARKLIKNFDLLSYEKRESILRMLGSHPNIPYYIAKFAAHHIANTGTHIMFSDTITSKGFRTVLKTKQGNEALVVVRPVKSSIGATILHEIFHDIRDSKYIKELIDYVKKYPSFEEEKKKYADDYKKNFKRELKDDELLTEEAAANIISERMDSDRFLQTWAKKDKNIIMRIYAGLSQYAHRIKNKSKPVDLELRRLEKKYTAALRSVMSERKYKKFISDLEEWLEIKTKYDIVILDDGKIYVKASRNVITGKTLAQRRSEISIFFDKLLERKPSLDIHTIDGEVLTITKAETADKARDNYHYVNGQRIKLSEGEYLVKLNAEAHIDELSEIAPLSKKAPQADQKNHSFAKDGFTYRDVYFEDFDGQYYRITLSIGHENSVATVYNVGKIEKSVPSSAKIIAVVGSKALDETLSTYSISQNSEKSTENQEKTEKTLYAPKNNSEKKEKKPKNKEKPVHEQVKEIMEVGEREAPRDVIESLAEEVFRNAPQYDEKGCWLFSQLWIKEQNLDIVRRQLEDLGRSLEIKNMAMKRKLTREFKRKKEELDKKYRELLEEYVKAQRRADEAEVALKEAIKSGIDNDISKLKGIYEERKDKAMQYFIEAKKQNINAQNISFLEVHFSEAYDTVDKILGNYGIDIDEAENREKANELSNDVFYVFGKKEFTHDDSAALAEKISEAFPALKENKAQIQGGITRRYNNLVKRRQKLAERYDPSGGLIAVYDAVEQLYSMLGNKKIMGSEILGDRDVKVFLEMIKRGFYRKRNAYGHVISIKPAQMREAMRCLKQFFDAYYKELFEGKHDEIWAGSFEIPEEIYTAVELLAAEGKDIEAGGDFSKEDLARLGKVIYAMLHLYKNFGLVWHKGNWTDAKSLAVKGVEMTSGLSSMNDTFLNEEGKLEKGRAKYLFNNVKKYLINAVTPDVAAQIIDGFDTDGVITELFREIRTGEIEFQNKKISLLAPIDTFYKENKKFEQHLRKDRYTFRGVELTAGDAVSLYMTGKREQAVRHLVISGLSYDRRSGNDGEIGGLINYSEANDKDEYNKACQDLEAELKNLEDQFSAEDKKFIKIAEEFFEAAKTLKAEADSRIFGYTNVIDGYYFPISVDKMSVALDVSDVNSITKDFLRVYSLSFNKDTQKNAFKKLHITNVADVINHHANGVSLYSAMYLRMKSFGKIYNMNVSDTGDVVTLRSTLKKLFKGADDYISAYLINSQGVTVTDKGVDRDINRHIGYIRKNLAPYAIGANLKSMLDQLTSYPIATSVLSVESLVKAFTRRDLRENIEKYSEVARVRFYDSSYVGKSMGNIDKVNKVGQMTLAPMGFLDKVTIGTYWVACQLEVEKNEGLALGSEENLKRAGELLDRVILETQAGGLSTEKSAYLRSKNELLKSLTMFTSTPTKQFSMLVSAIGTYNAYKNRVKNENATAKEKKAFDEAKAQLVRTAATLGVVIVIYVALSEVMKSFYDRDRKNKDGKEIGLGEDILIELGGATLGAIPLYGQIYEFLTSGYGISNSTVDFINDFMTAFSDMTGLLADAVSGKVVDKRRTYRSLKNSVDVVAQLTGIPVRNVENALKGVCRMISPNTVYKYDSLYYTPSYTKDLSEAINKGDEKLASTVLRLLYRNEKTGKLSTATAEEIVRLYEQYPSIIANTLSNKMTVDGDEIELNGKQFREFRNIYSKADAEVGKLIKSDMYSSLDDVGKARAIKTVYKSYFDKAKSKVLGASETKVNCANEFISLEKLVLGSAYIDSLSGEGKKEQAVKWLEENGYTDTETAFTLFANGYSGNDILKTVVSALNSSERDKEELVLTFGIDDRCIISNGKIRISQKSKKAG